jgi:hypothetical protein
VRQVFFPTEEHIMGTRARSGMRVASPWHGVATPDTLRVRKIAEIARTLNPEIEILLRTHSDEEASLLREENWGRVFMGEHELALAMTKDVLTRMGAANDRGPLPADG